VLSIFKSRVPLGGSAATPLPHPHSLAAGVYYGWADADALGAVYELDIGSAAAGDGVKSTNDYEESICYFVIMSLAELKQAVDDLSPDERQELAAHIWWCERRSDPAWCNEMGQRLDLLTAGQGHTQTDLEQIQARLKAEGR
jgi:hypothetical protein